MFHVEQSYDFVHKGPEYCFSSTYLRTYKVFKAGKMITHFPGQRDDKLVVRYLLEITKEDSLAFILDFLDFAVEECNEVTGEATFWKTHSFTDHLNP